MRLGQAAKILNITTTTIVQFLKKQGSQIEDNLNFKLSDEQYSKISEAFSINKDEKEKSSNISIEAPKEAKNIGIENSDSLIFKTIEDKLNSSKFGVNNKPKQKKETNSIDSEDNNKEDNIFEDDIYEEKIEKPIQPIFKKESIKVEKPILKEEKKESKPVAEKNNVSTAASPVTKQKGFNVLGFIDITNRDSSTRPSAEANKARAKQLKQQYEDRKRVINQSRNFNNPYNTNTNGANNTNKPNGSFADKKIKTTLTKLQKRVSKNVATKSLYRKEKHDRIQKHNDHGVVDETILEITRTISVKDLAVMIKIEVVDLLNKCKELGIIASINQALNADTIDLLADEYGFKVKFIDTDFEEEEEEDIVEENLEKRSPIVTIMGHVDHGKTSLLDYIRKTNVTKREAGGITQHIGAYKTTTKLGDIVFLDTPGHEAFTAMRVRGIDIADIVVIIIAADDGIQPQTKEIISQVKLSNSHIVIAINKIDREGANPDRVKEELANMNILVEDWGGKYQCQHISAKTGEGVEELLEKIILEAETMELKANYSCKAKGVVIEALLDRGRGFVNTVIVQNGYLRAGDAVVSGMYYGKVKSLVDENGKVLKEAGPSTPVQVIGLNGASKSGDKFAVVESEKDAKTIATEREQIFRQQFFKTQVATVQEEVDPKVQVVNIIIKGDVYGSIQALADSLLKLQNEHVKINILNTNVGIVNDSDINFAVPAKALIICFNVKPSPSAKKLAAQNKIEIKTYSLIYDAIEDLEDMVEKLSVDKDKKVIKGRAEVKALFKITKVGMIAGCFVNEGSLKPKDKVQIVRDGEVVYKTEITQIKHYKSDIKEAKVNTECGIYINNYNDYQEGDILESYEFAYEMNK